MVFDIWSVLFLITLAQGAFLIFILFKRKGRPSGWMIALLSVILVIQLESVVRNTVLFEYFPHLMGVQFPLYYLFGPLLFFFVKSRYQKVNIKPLMAVHLLPFFISIFHNLPIYLSSYAQKISVAGIFFGPEAPISLPFLITRTGINIGYLIACFYLVKMREKSDRQTSSLLFSVIVCAIALWLIYLVTVAAMLVSSYSSFLAYIRLLGFCIFIFYISYLLLVNQDMLAAAFADSKYEKSRLSPSFKKQTVKRINELLEIDKVFLDPELDHKQLARLLKTSPNKLSQVLSEELNTSFHDLINSRRVEEMKDRLVNPHNKKYSVTGIGYDCGFNSKSSMLRNFKRFTGLTPAAYQKEHLG